ncbi:MAG: trigger factor [bacterium]
MNCSIKKLPKGMAELTVSIEVDEAKPALEAAAAKISTDRPIEGFRPGKASYEAVKVRFGELAIYETALPELVRRHYVRAVKDNDLSTYGDPEINVTKLAPGNPIEFTATVALIPEVVQLAEVEKIKVKSEEPKVEDKEIDGTIRELQRMQTKEVRVDRAAAGTDKVIVDMDMIQANIPLDGGQARGHGIYLDEDYYVPGLKDQIVGMKEGESKEFDLKFPKDHYQKTLAGQDVHFKLTCKEVYELQNPPVDDEFAKSLGQESLGQLKEMLRGNILKDKAEKASQKVEAEILEKMVDKSRFGDIPERMVIQETDRMLHELQHSISDRGLNFDDYLKSIKKTLDDIKLELAQQAVQRVKTALLVREYGLREKIEVPDSEVMAEIEKMINAHSEDAEAQKTLHSEEYQDYIRTAIRNRKVVELLKERAQVAKK